MEVKNNAVRNTSTRTGSKSRKRPWRRENRVNTQLSNTKNPNILFSLTLAALTNPRNPSSNSLIKECSNKFLQSFLRKSPYLDSLNSEFVLSPILALLPLLLHFKCEEIVCTGARIVGALALVSIEVNEKIALDTDIVRVLVVKTMSSEKRAVKKAVCNAVLDLSTTSFGRQRLLELSGLEYLMWEGFAHVGLHQWSRKMEFDNFAPGSSGLLQAIMVNILHVAIRLISDNEPLFRKACLVAASSWPPETIDFLDNNQRAIFNQLMNKIHQLASFRDALEFVQIAVHRNEDPFHWLRWLDYLNGEKVYDRDIWHFTSDGIREILHSIYQNKDIAKATFDHVKSKYCSEVLFDDAKESFKILHSVYKEARMKYTNGMLSLHH